MVNDWSMWHSKEEFLGGDIGVSNMYIEFQVLAANWPVLSGGIVKKLFFRGYFH
jgi:hypothetical protein